MSDLVGNPEDRFSHDEAHLVSVSLTGLCSILHFLWLLKLPNLHYDNMPIQYTAIFHGCKNDKFQMKNCDIFLIFAQNIDRWYTLEPPQ